MFNAILSEDGPVLSIEEAVFVFFPKREIPLPCMTNIVTSHLLKITRCQIIFEANSKRLETYFFYCQWMDV